MTSLVLLQGKQEIRVQVPFETFFFSLINIRTYIGMDLKLHFI